MNNHYSICDTGQKTCDFEDSFLLWKTDSMAHLFSKNTGAPGHPSEGNIDSRTVLKDPPKETEILK